MPRKKSGDGPYENAAELDKNGGVKSNLKGCSSGSSNIPKATQEGKPFSAQEEELPEKPDIEAARAVLENVEDAAPVEGLAPPEKSNGQVPVVGKKPKKPPTNPAKIEATESDVARAFTAKYGDTMLFDHDKGCWFEWQGDHWQQDGTKKAFNYCRSISDTASSGLTPAGRKAGRKASFASGVEKFARCDPAHSVRQDVWDKDPWLLGCPGVTVDLRTGEARAPDPKDRITKRTAVAPADKPDCPLWLKFLNEATKCDTAVIYFLQLWGGYCLTGDTREHALIFLSGPGGNGKGTYLDVMHGILNDYAETAGMDTFNDSKFDKHTTDLAMLRGARLVTASETEEGRAWAEVRIKTLTGGDQVTARFMRQDNFTYLPEFKLTVIGNHEPVLHNVDDAMRRRFNIIPFVHKPDPDMIDRQLGEKLKAEWPGILRLLIEGCLLWQEDGLPRPASIVAATEDYFSDQDQVGQWLREECNVKLGDPNCWAIAGDMFKQFRQWAELRGEEAGTQTAMGNKLRQHGLRSERRSEQGRRIRVWIGVNLRSVGEHYQA